ncbi:AP2-like ethylene-responsive transcription factor [Chloropicon roscoffensis]|uniref:AP2-like ethylene-responsive transcription factor n=1 Tax=Chloropicon roscoffensis TaxID=1461544 RepID=A0AAX4P2H4_9CHLO
MGSKKIEKTLKTLEKTLKTQEKTLKTLKKEYKAYKKRELKLLRKNRRIKKRLRKRQRQSEGEGGDRGQAPNAAEGTSSGRGREGSGQESDTLLGVRVTTSSARRGSEGVAAERSGAGPKASEGQHPEAGAPVRREPLSQKRGSSGPRSDYLGVTFNKQARMWQARMNIKNKRYRLGHYKDEEIAAKVYDKAVIKIMGKKKAKTNFAKKDYDEEMRSRGASKMSKEEFIAQLRSEARRQNELERKAKEDKPKQAKTGYILFADHVRDRVKEDLTANLAEGEKLTAKAVLCTIASLWSKQDKKTKEKWQAKAEERRAAVDQTPERTVVEVGPSTARGGKAVEGDRPGPSKRPRHEGEGEAIKRERV